jgi:tetratricopeptide (TPR) repeat protein
MGLDWDAPAFSEYDPASPALLPLPPLKIDYGSPSPTGHVQPGIYEPLIADLESSLAREPDEHRIRARLARYCNNCAWGLATGLAPNSSPERAVALACRAVDLAPKQASYLNTLGVVQYRLGRYAVAITTLDRSLAANRGQFAGFDLFFLAMAHHRLGHSAQARACFDRAVHWVQEQKNLPEDYASELAAFRAEAGSVLAWPMDALPEDVFARPR